MKKAFFTLVWLSLTTQFVKAQPTQAEIDKMVKDATELAKKYGDTATKKKQGNNNGATNASYSSDPGSYGNVDNWRFPAKNTALLALLPKKVFTKMELVSFLNDLYSQLSKKMLPGIHSSVQSIAAKYNNDGDKMGYAAITGWYTNYREEALLLIIRAAVNNPDNLLLLNNCAAVLNMSGIEQKAIPVLKYVLQSYPDNPMLLNNLGQAYAGLGETDTAMVYLSRCIKRDPENPEANNTAGQIEATKGNKEKAIGYFEKSVKGAYNKPAALKLRKLKPDTKLVPFIRPRVNIPEYFNLFKYKLPEQCTSIDNAAIAKAEQEAFREMTTKQMQLYGGKIAELTQKKVEESMKIMNANGAGRVLKKDEFLAQPYYELCQIMARDLKTGFLKDLGDFNSSVSKKYGEEMKVLDNEYQSKLKIINAGFAEREKGCGEGKANSNCPTSEEKCKAHNNLANQYLPKFAYITEEWQKKAQLIFSTYFDELVYWHYLSLHPTGNENFLLQYYEFIEYYLTMMGSICRTGIIEPCEFTPTTAAMESNTIKDYDCPVDVEVGFAAGKFVLNCEKFSFSAGEGVIFGFEKNFKTKQSTVSIGIGAKLELGAKVGPLGAKVSAGVTEELFITFDGNNGFSDGGLRVEASASAGLETGMSKNIGKGVSIGAIKELAGGKIGVGATIGITSGCNFTTPFLNN